MNVCRRRGQRTTALRAIRSANKSTINQYVAGIDAIHDDADANDAQVVGNNAQRRRIRKELVNHEIKRMESLAFDEQQVASMKDSSTIHDRKEG